MECVHRHTEEERPQSTGVHGCGTNRTCPEEAEKCGRSCGR